MVNQIRRIISVTGLCLLGCKPVTECVADPATGPSLDSAVAITTRAVVLAEQISAQRDSAIKLAEMWKTRADSLQIELNHRK
jgi:hypothetical protein